MSALAKGKLDGATRWALGAGLALFMCAIAGIAFGWMLAQLIGGMYITFLMPMLVGILMGGAAAVPARLFGLRDKAPLITAVVMGALICFAGEQLFAFVRFAETFARENPECVTSELLNDPLAAAMTCVEQRTGEEGLGAYLRFVAVDQPAWSPIGMLGRSGIGVAGTVVVAIGELAVLIATAIASVLLRTRALRRPVRAPASIHL